jgi:3-hydroxyisobutyrate dehydrogenase-like beta-hydroxyacid dehydrogenase
MDIGFVGLGNMGEPMAALLLKAGHHVTVYNRTREKAARLQAQGATIAGSPREAAARAEVVVSMLADDSAVRDVTFGEEGIAAGLARGAAHISSSTISIDLSRELATEQARRGQVFLTAAVLGRPEAVEAKKAWILAGGAADALNHYRPLLGALGQGIIEIGNEPWQANLVKISLNFVLAGSLEILGEVFALVEKAGIERTRFSEILSNTLLNGPALAAYAERISRRNFDSAGFRLKLGLKDAALALAAGDGAAVPLPVANILRDHYLEAIAHGSADRDWSAVSESARRHAGLE